MDGTDTVYYSEKLCKNLVLNFSRQDFGYFTMKLPPDEEKKRDCTCSVLTYICRICMMPVAQNMVCPHTSRCNDGHASIEEIDSTIYRRIALHFKYIHTDEFFMVLLTL